MSIVARLKVTTWPRDARSGGHEGGIERAIAWRGHAAVLGRVAVVQAGDGLVRDTGEVVGRDVEEPRHFHEQV